MPGGAGIAFRSAYAADLLDGPPRVEWLEVHGENFFAARSSARRLLGELSERYAMSVHCVGLSLGSAEGLDRDHLEKFAELVRDIEPDRVSDHLAWSRSGSVYLNDLLPIPLSCEALRAVSANVCRAQDRLGRRLLVENPSSYLRLADSTIPEAEFLSRLAEQTGCGILLDLNNLYVSARNVGVEPIEYLRSLDGKAVGEIHVAGHEASRRPGVELLIDTHGARVAAPVWELYSQALALFGPRPTIVERDVHLPPFAELLAETAEAERRASLALRPAA